MSATLFCPFSHWRVNTRIPCPYFLEEKAEKENEEAGSSAWYHKGNSEIE
jgi:hypothetical protein